MPCAVNTTVEGNLRLPDPTLQAVKDYAVLLGYLHQLKKVLVTVFGVMAVDAYVIMHHDYAREIVYCLVHLHLKDVLGHTRKYCKLLKQSKSIYFNLTSFC